MFLLRHGQSTFNAAESADGRDPQIPDPPLTPLGRAQVAAAAERLADRGIVRLISSPYTRALQTAAIVAERLGLPVQVTSLVGERRLFSCDIGSKAHDLKQAWPALDFACLGGDTVEWWKPFPEGHESMMARIRTFENESYAWDHRDRTLIVSHWYYINGATGADPINAEIVRWD